MHPCLYLSIEFIVCTMYLCLYCIVLYYLTTDYLDAGRLAISQDPEGPATYHPDTGFLGFPGS
jgi:hypothetical protein